MDAQKSTSPFSGQRTREKPRAEKRKDFARDAAQTEISRLAVAMWVLTTPAGRRCLVCEARSSPEKSASRVLCHPPSRVAADFAPGSLTERDLPCRIRRGATPRAVLPPAVPTTSSPLLASPSAPAAMRRSSPIAPAPSAVHTRVAPFSTLRKPRSSPGQLLRFNPCSQT